MSQPHGVPVLESAIPLSQGALNLVKRGVATLWTRISAADPRAEERPLLLSYDVHPTPDGPVEFLYRAVPQWSAPLWVLRPRNEG